MSGRIFLIVEDENDGEIVQEILKKRNIAVKVEIRKPTGGSGGISRLAKQLARLIETARRQIGSNDCIAILHDEDIQRQQENRELYQRIEQLCAAQKVKHIVARDELEAWMLADSGLCEWLEVRPRNWDEQAKPSDELRSLVRAKRLKYQGAERAKIVSHLSGDGDEHSPSMREALKQLENAPCIRS